MGVPLISLEAQGTFAQRRFYSDVILSIYYFLETMARVVGQDAERRSCPDVVDALADQSTARIFQRINARENSHDNTVRIIGDSSDALFSGNLSNSTASLLPLLGFGIGFGPDLLILAMTRKAFKAMKVWGSRADPDETIRPTSVPLVMIDDLMREKIDRLNELEIDSTEALAQQNPSRLLPRVPYDLGLLVDCIAQAQLYVLVRDDVLQKLRAIYIRNVFDCHIA